MHRRSFLGTLCAAPIAALPNAKSLDPSVGESAIAEYVNSVDPFIHRTGWEEFRPVTFVVTHFQVEMPSDQIAMLKVSEGQVVLNPEFPLDQFLGG